MNLVICLMVNEVGGLGLTVLVCLICRVLGKKETMSWFLGWVLMWQTEFSEGRDSVITLRPARCPGGADFVRENRVYFTYPQN